MRYPLFKQKATIGVSATSSGVPKNLHSLVEQSSKSLEAQGYKVVIGETTWTQDKAKSAPASKRASEFFQLMMDPNINGIIPPWGGELLIEILPEIDFAQLPPKWILGYSDTSSLLLAITLQTGIATAHGTNFIDLRGEYVDETTAMWETVLLTKAGESVTQYASKMYQKKWQFENPSPCVFHLTEPTQWKITSDIEVTIRGRFLGGCIDVIRHLVGTPYGDVAKFRAQYTKAEPIIWYLENCQLSTTDLRRSLVQMKLAGWFDHCSGILFGRSAANTPVDNYEIEDVYHELAEELKLPIVYNIDCGHIPPQITFVNGAMGEVVVKESKGKIIQTFI